VEGVVAAAFLVIGNFFAWRAAKHSKETKDDLRTNHGKRPGEYLEMIGEVLAQQALHERDDERRFKAIELKLDERSEN
jgi:hypothetical protein